MRKFAINPIDFGNMLDSHPNEDEPILNTPEASVDNKGRASIVGVAEELNGSLDLSYKVHKSGLINVYNTEEGGEILCRMNNPVDNNGDQITDSDNWMGSDGEDIPYFDECLAHSTGSKEYNSPKVISLKKWLNYNEFGGFDAMAVLFDTPTATGVGDILVFRHQKRETNSGWGGVFQPGLEGIWGGGVNNPSCDLVEMEDGVIVLAVIPYGASAVEDVYIYRSFNCGDSWERDGTFNAGVKLGGSGPAYLSLERIGSRLVILVGSDAEPTGKHEVKSFYSDDVGYTWSVGTSIRTGVPATPTHFGSQLDLLMSKTGKLYAAIELLHGVSAYDVIHIYSTLDGITWTLELGTTSITGMAPTLVEDEVGRLILYTVFNHAGGSTVQDYNLYRTILMQDASSSVPPYEITEDFADLNFHALELNAASINFDGHIELFVKYYDNDTSDTYAGVMLRTRMWSALPLRAVNETFWCAVVYPSPSDPSPDLAIWNRVGGGTSLLEPTSNRGQLKLTGGVGNYVDYWKSPLPIGNRYDNGLIIRFALGVQSGIAHIRLRATNSATLRQDFYFTFNGATDAIDLYDAIGSSQLATFTPTNWELSSTQHYMMIYNRDSVGLYRASRSFYQELMPFEQVILETSLPNTGYAIPDSEFHWGILQLPGYDVATIAKYAYISIYNGDYDYEPDFDIATDTDKLVAGKKSTKDAIGLTMGAAHKIAGSFVNKEDQWEIDSGAIFQAENIFNPSPSIRWQEPIRGLATSDDAVFELTHPNDNYDKEHKFPFNCIGLFGKNFNGWKLETQETSGGGWTTQIDTSLGTVDEQIMTYGINSVEENIISVLKYNTFEEDMLINQYGSTLDQNFYIQFTSGFLVDRIYKVERAELWQSGYPGGEFRLFMPYNMQQMGAVADDFFKLFTDRCFTILDPASTFYQVRSIRFTITGSIYTDPLEDQFRLGTLFLGQYYDMPDDEWVSSMKMEPNNLTIRTRAGREINRLMGKTKRIVDVSYSGQIDRGMFKNNISEAMRLADFGHYPIVWIDDDSGLYQGTDFIFHHNPLLCRMQKGFGQPRRSYFAINGYQAGNTIQFNRNIVDVNSIVLEEII